jgi:type I restriction-modification system DNA methylase subunit
MGKSKHEALTVTRFIDEVLVNLLSVPLKQIVNDTTFSEYTGSKRPDLLISEFEFDTKFPNQKQFIENLVACAEAKDNCQVNDKDWMQAKADGVLKAKKLEMPFFVVTNCETSIFYNTFSGVEISLNSNPIREFQTIDILRLIKNRLKKEPELKDIKTNVDSLSTISESIFSKKLWELAREYRDTSFKNNIEKIDFTIGFISLEYFEEKEIQENKKDVTKLYWSGCADKSEDKLVANLGMYIQNLEAETGFAEFKDLMELVKRAIIGEDGKKSLVDKSTTTNIYRIIDSMKPLHGCGFDLFGAVYEMFASKKEKQEFGEYFTKRHYAHILSKLLLKEELYFDNDKKFKMLDPACGTGGFLTESFKILKNNYERTKTDTKEALRFLKDECFYGIDVREENISRTKLNMFLVGDGHTNMFVRNTLKHKFGNDEKYDYIITNPPFGSGTIDADTTKVSSSRKEVAFLVKVIKLLKDWKKACIIVPDGILENPTLCPLRKELLEKCNISAIISLPKFAFAPYTKEKTYALYVTKKPKTITKSQTEPIWMYIIDNDGYANSDKKFPTKLRNNRNGWLHDEISGWVSTEGEETVGKLEESWLKFDDSENGGTSWITEKGERVKLRKGGFFPISVIENDRFFTLLPEYYLRPYTPNYLTLSDLDSNIKEIENQIRDFVTIINEN